MALYQKRLKAREMRKRGTSIIKIAKELAVSKASVSLWCRDIALTKKQIENLKNNKGVSWTTGQRMGAETNKKKRLDAIQSADIYGRKMIGRISKRELLLIATALYWSEGSKTDTTSSWMFVNSDPQMILLMESFLLSVMGISREDVACCVQINEIHKDRIDQVLNFWKKLLKLKNSQIRSPYFVHTNSRKVYENYDKYFGVCRLFVRKSKYLKYRMLGLIKAVKNDLLPA